MSEETYNGWKGNGNRASAYATWRIMLEMYDGYDLRDAYEDKPDEYDLATHLRDQVVEYIDENCSAPLIAGWAMAFVEDANFYEMAENMLSDWEDEEEEEEEDNSCNQCEAMMINGVFCHETGCPNKNKIKVDGEWVDGEWVDREDDEDA
jgi:hypothetical protein